MRGCVRPSVRSSVIHSLVLQIGRKIVKNYGYVTAIFLFDLFFNLSFSVFYFQPLFFALLVLRNFPHLALRLEIDAQGNLTPQDAK